MVFLSFLYFSLFKIDLSCIRVVICACRRLMVMVMEKQRIISKAIDTKKMKFAKVSNPSQLARVVSGSGKIAIIIKTMGSRSQAIELRIDILFLAKLVMTIISNISAEKIISIWMLLIFISPNFYG